MVTAVLGTKKGVGAYVQHPFDIFNWFPQKKVCGAYDFIGFGPSPLVSSRSERDACGTSE